MPVDYTNLPHVIAQNERVISINNTMQIDLQGQAASERAKALIGLAHPDFRDRLAREAREKKLIQREF